METFIGRLTSNAQINTLKDERQVVNFSIAINNIYRAKNDDEQKKATTYINCAFWLSTKVAEHLTKGSIVEISGRLFVRAYLSGNEPKASLNCHVNHIKIHHFQRALNSPAPVAARAVPAEADDNLPF
jgi:single-strand DNA-binding protein